MAGQDVILQRVVERMGRSETVLAQALTGEEIAELEALADAADVDTRGSWEHKM